MIDLNFFKKIRFNRCEILLSESESYYLYSKFHNYIVLNENKSNAFKKQNIKNILNDFCEVNETRYFKKEDINYLTNYYFNMINEEIGRGRESAIKDPISGNDVFEIYTDGDLNTENCVDNFEGSDVFSVTSKASKKKKNIKVDSPDAAHVMLKNLEVNVVKKL
jgi:hypothetical protein